MRQLDRILRIQIKNMIKSQIQFDKVWLIGQGQFRAVLDKNSV